MKYIYFLLLFSTCTTSNFYSKINSSSIVFENKNEYAYSQLILQEENVFSYQTEYGLVKSFCSGKWYIQNNKLVLNTDTIFDVGILASQENLNNIDGLKSVEVSDLNNSPLDCRIQVLTQTDTLTLYSNLAGQVEFFLENEILKIAINYLGDDYEYNVKNKNASNFSFAIKEYDLGKCQLKNEAWNIKSNRILIDPNNRRFKKSR